MSEGHQQPKLDACLGWFLGDWAPAETPINRHVRRTSINLESDIFWAPAETAINRHVRRTSLSLASVGFETGSFIRPDPKDYESPFQDQIALEIQIKKGASKTRPFFEYRLKISRLRLRCRDSVRSWRQLCGELTGQTWQVPKERLHDGQVRQQVERKR